jgi:hypothetical protein
VNATRWGICRRANGSINWIALCAACGFPEMLVEPCSADPRARGAERWFAMVRMLQLNAAEYVEVGKG